MGTIKLEVLTNEIWEKLENTDSNQVIENDDLDKVIELSEEYDREWKTKLETIKNNHSIPAPIIFEMNGRYHKVSGNTRLMLAKALGKIPMIAIVRYK